MKIFEVLERAEAPTLSCGIIPPLWGGSVHEVMELVATLMPFARRKSPTTMQAILSAARGQRGTLQDVPTGKEEPCRPL